MKKRIIMALATCIIATVVALGLTACGSSLVKPKNIKYDGTIITWDRVELAEYYNVSINGGEKQRVNTNVFTYNANGREFEVTVGAVNAATELTETRTFHPLATIEQIEVAEDGTLSWGAVNGASAYKISVNGTVLSADFSSTVYDGLTAGTNRVKIRPIVSGDDSYYSLWSSEKSVYINSTPSSVKYDGEKITWTGNAQKYEVNINGQKEEVATTQYFYDANSLDFVVEVKALGNHTTTFDSKVASKEFHYLENVTNLVMTDGILSWDKVVGATEYKIKVNNVVQNVKITEESYDGLTVGRSLDISLLPYAGEDYFSVWSEVKTVYILESPVINWNADLELDGEANNNLIWDSVNGAVGYAVEVKKDGQSSVQSFGAAQSSFAHAYKEEGVYTVRVKSIADNDGVYCDSKYSTAITVERLSAPKPIADDYIRSDAGNISAGFTVNYQAVANASGYQLYKDGVLLQGLYTTALSITDRNVADDSISAQQEYNYILKSMGGVKTISGKKYVTLPCLSEKALTFKITVQAMPTGLEMAGFNAQWNTVSGNNGYNVKYSGTTVTATTETLDLSTIKAGTYGISVCTKGNGSSTLPSNYTAEAVVTRLSAPTNIKITYGEGEGQLGYDAVANAKSYQTYIDAGAQSIPENSWDNMYQFIKETGTTLFMVSVANYYLDTVYYMTSEASPTQQFIRLSTPIFPDGALSNSKELLWNAPSNINTQEYTPTYEVYESNVMQTGGVQNATKFNIEYLDGGDYYTFRVKAVGNDSKYLDSEMSEIITVYKLATPTFDIVDGKYVWGSVVNASSYVLEIDGERVNNDIHVSGSQYSYMPLYTEVGNHTVKLYAVGDGYNNINSSNYVYTQVVSTLFAPEISFGYSSDSFVNGGYIRVDITKASENAVNYQYEIAGESIVSSDLYKSKTIESTGTYYVRVKALGGVFDSDDVYYVDSQYVGGNSGYKIILLGTPTLSTFSINSDGAIKWTGISDANGYDYCIAYDDGEYSEVQHVSKSALTPIANHKNYSKIKIKVRCYGGTDSVVSSQWVEWIWVNPNK